MAKEKQLEDKKYKTTPAKCRYFKTFITLLYRPHKDVLWNGQTMFVESNADVARSLKLDSTRFKIDLKCLERLGLIDQLRFDHNRAWFKVTFPYIRQGVPHGEE